jgi:hypothetical protein
MVIIWICWRLKVILFIFPLVNPLGNLLGLEILFSLITVFQMISHVFPNGNIKQDPVVKWPSAKVFLPVCPDIVSWSRPQKCDQKNDGMSTGHRCWRPSEFGDGSSSCSFGGKPRNWRRGPPKILLWSSKVKVYICLYSLYKYEFL